MLPPDEREGCAGDVMSKLVEDAKYRTILGIELVELKAFLGQRCSELASTSQPGSATAIPASLQQSSLAALQEMKECVSDCQAAFASDKVKMLTSLKASSHYFDRTAAALSQQGSQESKYYRHDS